MRQKICITLLLFMICTAEAWADVVVIMRREAEASGNYVRVCDIARVEGPKEQANEVALIVLGPTPPRGQTHQITRWDIENRLFEMGVAASVTFTGNDMVRVFGGGASTRHFDDGLTRPLQDLSPVIPFDGETVGRTLGAPMDSTDRLSAREEPAKPIKPAAKVIEASLSPAAMADSLSATARSRIGDAISGFLAGKYSRADMEIEARVLTLGDAIADSVHEVKVEEAIGGRVPGKATLRLSIKDTPESPARSVMVSADTEVFGLAPVATRQLTRGELLEPRDVTVSRVRMESGKGYLPPNPDAVIGRALKKNVKPGEPILAVDAVQAEAVKRGNLVVVIASGAGWEVKTIGKAMGGGGVGELITVEDSATRAKYPARISGPGTVTMIVPKDRLNKK